MKETGNDPYREKMEKFAAVLRRSGLSVFEYFIAEDRMILYDDQLQKVKEIPEYISWMKTHSNILSEDLWKVQKFYAGEMSGPLEIRVQERDGHLARKILDSCTIEKNGDGQKVLIGSVRDVTEEKRREELLENQARRDSLTMLYNHSAGKSLINDYLTSKDPYDSCGLMVIDIDYFKNVNDIYGHLFGDQVLMEMARLFLRLFDIEDVVMRAGGDEFVVLLKNITHRQLVKKAMQLVKAVNSLTFQENDYSPACSVGICFLPENVSGYTYDQLFGNADWALYRAKESGRNRYVFCDNLRRFQTLGHRGEERPDDIDARYFRNDVISTAFEIFEKMNSFESALELLMRVIGIRFGLDRITVIRTDIKEKKTARQFQWTSEYAPEVLKTAGQFTKEDFLTLFHSYDENGTVVLQHDDMGMYSRGGAELLMQGEAKTVVYAAMYCEGKYTGAISYVVCREKKDWTRQNRKELGELTKIISAHLAKSMALNMSRQIASPFREEYDRITGLLSFARFQEEAERLIVGGYAESHVMMYIDLENFKYFNQKYGYSTGDQLLKELSSFLIDRLETVAEVYFTRVVADQFLLFRPYEEIGALVEEVERINREFMLQQAERFPEARIRLRTGIYPIEPGCLSASTAIDAANYARRDIRSNELGTSRVYDEELRHRQNRGNEILNGMDMAMQKGQFVVYLQPRYSIHTHEVVGAEALVRWKREDKTILEPDDFVPLYEANGRIRELDYYVFGKVAAFLAENERLGRRQYPISVNASALHALDEDAVGRYLDILNRYGVSPRLVEIELTETSAVSDYTHVFELLKRIRESGMSTALDDFGAGYSLMNVVINLPIDAVKLDRSFIRTCTASERGIYFLKQIIGMVRGLGYRTVCEGVESMQQAEILKKSDCQEGQGYWFAYPMPMEEYVKLVYGQKDHSTFEETAGRSI